MNWSVIELADAVDQLGAPAPAARCAILVGMERSAGSVVLRTGEDQGTTVLEPSLVDPELDGGHERMSHIVLEGFVPEEGDYVAAGPSVVEGIVNGTPVRALCGKVWVPGRDPKRYPLCPTCKEIAEAHGWAVPAS